MIIDTRNDYEVSIGTFKTVLTLKLNLLEIFQIGFKKI